MGIRWKFTSALEDLDFADDLALVSSKFTDIQAKTMMLKSTAVTVGLRLNTRKCKTMRMNVRCGRRVKIGEEEVEGAQNI